MFLSLQTLSVYFAGGSVLFLPSPNNVKGEGMVNNDENTS
jgi:hypothetical protein